MFPVDGNAAREGFSSSRTLHDFYATGHWGSRLPSLILLGATLVVGYGAIGARWGWPGCII